MRPQILMVSGMALFPETGYGGSKRLFHLAQRIAGKSDLDLVWMDGCREITGRHDLVERVFDRQIFLPHIGKRNAWRRVATLPVDVGMEISESREKLQSFLKGKNYAAILFAFPLSLSLAGLGNIGNLPCVYLEDDLLLEQYRQGITQGPLSRRGLNLWRLWQARRFFRNKLRGFKIFVTISEKEKSIVQAYFPWIETTIVGYGIPLRDFSIIPPALGSPCIGFIGNYGHYPNLDAAEYLINSIRPELAAKLPDVRILIAGPGLPERLAKEWSKFRGVEYLGKVETLASFYERVQIIVNPIRKGRGLRTKLVEAAAFGRPIVSTVLGREGLEDLQVALADNPQSFASAILAMFRSDAGRSQAEANRLWVEKNSSIEATGDRLLSVLLESGHGLGKS